MTAFKYVGTQNGFNIYKNELFIPMGFTYDEYITKEEFEKLTTPKKVNVLMHALVLDEEDIEKNSDLLTNFTSKPEILTRLDFETTSRQKAESACYSFEYDTNGFEAKNRLDKEAIVFFSVPYTEGWSAKVNGKEAEIIKASYGFMAVRCEAGENDIVFRYITPGIRAGALMTLISAATLTAYAVYFKRREKKGEE